MFKLRPVYQFRNIVEVISTMALFFFYLFKIRSYSFKNHIDILWGNWLQIGFIAKLAVGKKIPVLTSILGADVRNSPAFITRIMAKAAPHLLNMYAGDYEVSGWIKQFGFNAITVPNCYQKKSIRINPNPNDILVVGRLESDNYHWNLKGIGEKLIPILRSVLNKKKNIKVYFIGSGSRDKLFRELTKDNKRFIFTGWLNNYDSYLKNAVVIIGASGHGGATLDTVPNGIPLIISTKDPAGSFWKNKSNCLFFNPDKPKQFERVILYALTHKKKMMKIANQAKADFRNFALPIDEAAKIWKKAIEDFLILNK